MKDSSTAAVNMNMKAAKKERLTRMRLESLKRNKLLYLMILPGVLYFIIFKYLPMGGLVIAFQDYQPYQGITGSPWVGFKHFIRLFTEPTFFMLLSNTLILFALNIVIFFRFRSSWRSC